jgi:guanine deaminase
VLHFKDDPGDGSRADSYEYWPDGVLVIASGRVQAVGAAAELLPSLSDAHVIEHGERLLMPGFIDTHIHFPQTDMIASGGDNLLDWLERYTFPAERRFVVREHAQEVAEFFLDEMLRNGTTTAQVLSTVHASATDAFFAAAAARKLRMIAGKSLMDCNVPEYLRDTAHEGESDTRALIERWHGQERMSYAITPRFAASSSVAQLQSAGKLAAEYPDVFIHSHLAENLDEVAWVRRLFPAARSYLDVYDRFGLLRERATYAHSIHLDDDDRRRMAITGASASFCPTSNLYLGSGLFDIAAADATGLRFALGTDVGAGTSFSMLRTLGDAYKVAQLRGQRLSPVRAFYLATLGAARTLGLEAHIGHFGKGVEADFVVLDLAATPLAARRAALCHSLEERLLLLMILGDDRSIASTYVLGEAVSKRAAI